MVKEDQDDDDVEKVSWSGEPVGSKLVLLHVSGQSSVIGCRGSPPVFSGISWSVRETEVSNQRTAREPAFPKGVTDTPNVSKSNSGYSLSSLFKGETGHMTHKASGSVGHMTDVGSATWQEKLEEGTSCPSLMVSQNCLNEDVSDT